MKVELDIRFKPGDVVWRKNLVTNEAYQVTIEKVTSYFLMDADEQSYLVVYHIKGDTPMSNNPGKVDANNAFATKEEADACPPYRPNGVIWHARLK